jgi:hypothetical protein
VPLVVIDRSRIDPMAAICETRFSTPRRRSGSPPVIRILFTPSEAATRATRVISWKVRICDRGFQGYNGLLFGLGGVGPVKIGRLLGFRQAVDATEVASIRDANSEIANDPIVSVLENPSVGHGVTPLGGELVWIGTILTVPSRRTSTLRSAFGETVLLWLFLLMPMRRDPPFLRAPP